MIKKMLRQRCVYASAAALCVLLAAGMPTSLKAQAGGATLAGTILDQAGKTIQGASVVAKSDAGSGTAESDANGHFALTGLAAGTYTVETTATGFARNTRTDVPVLPSGTADISITLFVDSVSQSVSVQESVSLATETAPAGNTLEALAARCRRR